jgi:hypothetical protein
VSGVATALLAADSLHMLTWRVEETTWRYNYTRSQMQTLVGKYTQQFILHIKATRKFTAFLRFSAKFLFLFSTNVISLFYLYLFKQYGIFSRSMR